MKILILGGGMVGRVAKMLIPIATILERKGEKGAHDILVNKGAHLLHEFIPSITSKEVEVTVGYGDNPHNLAPLDSVFMMNYAERMGCEPWTGKDTEEVLHLKHKSTRWLIKPPQVPIAFDSKVQKIDLAHRVLFLADKVMAYDILINTIPLPEFMKLAVPNLSTRDIDLRHQPVYFDKAEGLKDMPEGRVYIEYALNKEYQRYIYTKDFMWAETTEEPRGYRFVYPYGKLSYSKNAKDLLKVFKAHSVYSFGRYALWDKDATITSTYHDLNRWSKALGLWK